MGKPVLFGVRHLSPAAAYHVRKSLQKTKPDLILIEGPSDLTEQMHWICHKKTKPPVAIMAYTKQIPVRTILYPFAVYSPEYQAILWAFEHDVPCRFMDLPSDVFLAIGERKQTEETQQITQEEIQDTTESVYEKLETLTGEPHDTFWERYFEQLDSAYDTATAVFGKELRENTQDDKWYTAENTIREAYMKKVIVDAEKEGFENIFCVCGAYHVSGLEENEPMTEKEMKHLPKLESASTLMPYSYYRLSKRGGYGAGNQAPAYFELLWNDRKSRKGIAQTAYSYLTRLAEAHRKAGNLISSAEVIEAVRLSQVLAQMRGSKYPVLTDLKDAAMTCIGHGHFSEIAAASAKVEIGNKIGALPDGVSRTSIQDDFYRQLKDLNLEKYRAMEVQTLDLDLRERLRVKSEKAAFLDLRRSFFLHRLRVLGVSFATLQNRKQDGANWGEYWNVWWNPEAEIEIVEAALLGDTVENAASFALKERADKSQNISDAAMIFQDAFLCGMPNAASYALSVLQRLAVDTAAITEISKTTQSLSYVIRYGDLRKFDPEPIIPLLEQLYLRACLTLEDACNCDDKAANDVMESIERLNQVQRDNENLDEQRWLTLLETVSDRDDINTRCSGFAMATLIERGKVSEDLLAKEVSRRLSKGVPADLGAGWFEGLAKKNRYALIARLSLWKQLNQYLDTLDDEAFRRALVFLRRAFADFSGMEKNDIAENLGEIWGVQKEQAADLLMQPTTESEQAIFDDLDGFDFDDI